MNGDAVASPGAGVPTPTARRGSAGEPLYLPATHAALQHGEPGDVLPPWLERPDPTAQTATRATTPATRAATTLYAHARRGRARLQGRHLIVALLVVTLTGLVALVGAARGFDGRAKIGTRIAGVGVAGQTVSQLQATVQQLADSLRLTASLDGRVQQLALADLGVTFDSAATAEQALGSGWWPVRRVNVPLVWHQDTAKLQDALNQAFLSATDRPQDAAVSLDATSGHFSASPGAPGKTIDAAPVGAAIAALARGDAPGLITLTATTQAPAILTAAATQASDTANALVGASYTFSADQLSFSLRPPDVAPWLALVPNAGAGTIGVNVNESALSAALPDLLASQITTPPVNEQVTKAGDGTTTPVRPGADGTKLADPSAVVQAMTQALTAHQPLTLAVATTAVPFSTDTVTTSDSYDQPNGKKWIDVNQTTFQVTLYQGTTPVTAYTAVTGADITPTVDGTFYIYAKVPLQDMRGRNPDGTPYFDKDVPWIAYFLRGYALHGAPWWSTWGFRASHGCVNLPVDAAHYVYDWSTVGTKVVVHW